MRRKLDIKTTFGNKMSTDHRTNFASPERDVVSDRNSDAVKISIDLKGSNRKPAIPASVRGKRGSIKLNPLEPTENILSSPFSARTK
jgi:hypothetical protein